MTFEKPSDFEMEQRANDPHLDKLRMDACLAPPVRANLVDLGIINFGYTTDGSLTGGINLGIVRLQLKGGLQNEVAAGVGIDPLASAGFRVGAGVNECGFNTTTAVSADVLNTIGTNARFDAGLGANTGAGLRAGGYVGPGEANGAGRAWLQPSGLDLGANGNAQIRGLVGGHAGSNLALNDSNSQVRAGTGGYLGPVGADSGLGVWSDGNRTARPNAYLSGRYQDQRDRLDINPQIVASSELPLTRPEQMQGRPVIETRTLPAPYSEPAYKSFSHMVRQDLVDETAFTVQSGQRTYHDVAAALLQGASSGEIAAEARRLEQLNGPQRLKPGMSIALMNPYELDHRVRTAAADQFGLQPPQA